jgi:predicted metal-binding protein
MAKIGILSCSKIKNDLSCGAVGCLRAFNGRSVVFKRYKEDKDLTLVGLTACDGCPTLYAHERILNKVKPLIELNGAENIHIASCMVKMCPFVNKFKSIINAKYPDVEIVMGTDTEPESPYDAPIQMYKGLFMENTPDITCAVKELMSKMQSGAIS